MFRRPRTSAARRQDVFSKTRYQTKNHNQQQPMPNNAQAAKDAWNNNNLAHTDTWGYLFVKEELNESFADARDVRMDELAFYNPAASPQFIAADAKELAASLDRAFRKKSRAVFETDWTVPKAVEAMQSILKDKEKLVCELAIQVDDIYSFTGEKLG